MTRQSFCHNADGSAKFTFFQKREAKKVARMVATRSQYLSDKGAIHLYRCPSCLGYHVGHDTDGGFAA
jgi:hypothetical protein